MGAGRVAQADVSISRPDYITLMAFFFLVLIGGSNAVAVRLSNLELPPFWGAALRFSAAAIIFWIIVLSRRIPLPRGRSLAGAILFGLLSSGISYALLYWGLLGIEAGLTMVILAFVPLLTLFLALAHRLETVRWHSLLGALIAIAGILVSLEGRIGSSIPIPYFLAVLAAAVCIAEGSVIFKLLPESNPIATNALAVTTGAIFLVALSLVIGEVWQLPSTAGTWATFGYLVLMGTVLLFYLYLFVLTRWTASATTYAFLLFPVSTVIIAARLAGEVVTTSFVIGGIIVLVGVWLGAARAAVPVIPPDCPSSTQEAREVG